MIVGIDCSMRLTNLTFLKYYFVRISSINHMRGFKKVRVHCRLLIEIARGEFQLYYEIPN